jgi:DNA-binding SARP family transcriptional activator/DNA-binding beta-propeller fold protein YncE
LIVDALWDGEREPANPSRAAQTYVSRLRRLVGNERLTSTAAGYTLVVEPGELDVDRLSVQIEQARALRAAGNPVEAAGLYRAAEGLWVTGPWAEFGDRFWAVAEVERLTTLRVAAAQEHASCLLEADDPAAALERVRPLLREHPLWDGLREIEMLALHRLGRSVEASRVYRHHRDAMIDQLGLEPTAELADLDARILRDDSTLAISGPTVRGFELITEIDRNDLGTVWRARQPSLEREVRLTVINPDLANDPEFIRNFEAQTRVLSQIDHPSVGPLLDAWRDFRGAFIVSPMPLSVANSPPTDGWSSASIKGVLADVADALAELHGRGLALGGIQRVDIALDASGNASLLGGAVKGANPNERESDLRSLASIGLELLAESGDVDSALQQLLETVAFGGSVDIGPADLAGRLRPSAEAPSSNAVQQRRRLASTREAAIRNPYKGLLPFDLGDADDFFGRKDIIAELVTRIGAGRFVTVVGPSGSGKSSVIRAGVLPALMSNAELGGRPWFGVTITPGVDPFEAVEAALLRIAVNPPSTLLEQLTADPRGLGRAVDRALPDDRSDLLLMVDQFEELWTVTPNDVRERFVSALVEAVTSPQSRLKVVATLRADFYDRPLADPELGALLAEGSMPLPAPTAAELEDVVLGPARRVGLDIDPSVVAEFVQAGTADAASLPLIQFALTELVEHRRTDVIDSDDLRRLGGISGSIARRAEETFQGLDTDAQDVVRLVFGRLVTLTSGGATRRRAAQAELTGDDAGRVVEAFACNRLLAFDRDHETREPTVEVAHEALLTAWPRLGDWITEDGDELRVVGRLVAGSARWEESGDDGELLRGASLAAAEALVDQNPQRLSAAEHRYVAASSERLSAEQDRDRRRTRRLRQSLAAVAALLAVALIAGSIAVAQRNTARQAAFDAESFRLLQPADNLANSDPSTALLLAAEAYRRSPSPETLGVIQRVMLEVGPFLGTRLSGVDVRAAHWLEDNRIVALSPGSVILVEADSGRILDQTEVAYPGDDPLVDVGFYQQKLALHGQSGRVAVTAAEGSVAFFEVNDGRLLAAGEVSVGVPVRSVAFSPDGGYVYAGDAAGSAHEIDTEALTVTASWPVFDGPEPGDKWEIPDGYSTGDTGDVIAQFYNQDGVAAIHATGEWVAAAGGSRVVVWGRDDQTRLIDTFAVHDRAVGEDGEPVLLFPNLIGTADGRSDQLILLDKGNRIGQLDIASERQTWVTGEGLGRNAALTFSLDADFKSASVAAVYSDGAVRTLDPTTGGLTGEVLPVLTGQTVGMGVDLRGRTAAVATTTGVTLVALDGAGPLNDAFPVDVQPDGLTISAGGRLAGTASFAEEATVVFDRADNGYEPRRLDREREPSRLGLYNHMTLDPSVGIEWRLFGPDQIVQSRPIDGETLEPLSDWLDDTRDRAVDVDNGLQYIRHEAENFFRPNGQHLFRVHSWPDGTEVGTPIEVPTGEVGSYPNVVLEGGRLIVGINPFPGTFYAYDTEVRGLVEPPFAANGAAHTVRFSPNLDTIYIARDDGGIEERDATDYTLLREMVGPEAPSDAVAEPVIADQERDLWMTTYSGHPRLLDPTTGSQIGATFPHDDPEVDIGIADGHNGAPIQLATMVEGTARVWNLATETWFDLACDAVGRNLTAQEWDLVGPQDTGYQITCPQWPDGRDT